MYTRDRLLCGLLAATSLSVNAAIATFEDVAGPNEQTYAGPGGGRYWSGLVPPANGSVDSLFSSGGAGYANRNTDFGGFLAWEGFAYSNTTDTQTAGFGNQFSAFAGGGAGGSANYAVAYAGEFNAAPRISFSAPVRLSSLEVTNTTYTALSMRDGDSFAKKFGGASGEDPDFLKLTITGRDGGNAVTGTRDVYLADFRAADTADDFILAPWMEVALGSLGVVSALEFSMVSSDVGPFGINTPLYFALDNLVVVPVPAAAWLFMPAVLGLARARLTRRCA
jgi:hypothetical protein